MLKGIRGVQLDDLKVLRAPDAKIKYFERFFCRSMNYNSTNESMDAEFILRHFKHFCLTVR